MTRREEIAQMRAKAQAEARKRKGIFRFFPAPSMAATAFGVLVYVAVPAVHAWLGGAWGVFGFGSGNWARVLLFWAGVGALHYLFRPLFSKKLGGTRT